MMMDLRGVKTAPTRCGQAAGVAGDGTHRGRLARPACAALAIAFATAAGQASAQDDDGFYWLSRGDQIVVTATRTPTRIEDVPAVVSVKTDEEIADELATDIKDLVRFEPGVSVQRQPARFNAALSATGRSGNDGFTIRGIGGNRVLIQVDGVRVPDGFSFGAQSVGRGDYVDLGLVRSVEILRGPTSALYGSDGLAGAVSFVTSDPADFLSGGKSLGGLVRAAYSSADNEFSETAILAGRSGDWSAMLAYTRRDFNELENRGTVGGTGAARTLPNPQDGRSNAALARIVYDPANGHKVRLTGEYLDTYLFTEGLTGRSATVDLLRGIDTGKRKRVSLDWTWEGEGAIDFARVAAYWQDAEDRQFTDEDRTPAADRERLNLFENRVLGLAADARADFHTGGIGHRLVFGGDFSSTRQNSLRDGVLPTPPDFFPNRAFPTTDFTRAGLFVGDEISLAGGALTLYPALRFDWYRIAPQKDPILVNLVTAEQSRSRVSPKIGAVWKVTDNVRLFVNYATGFRAPEPNQANQSYENLAQGYTSRPNPNLGPERSESIEGGVRLSNKHVSLDVTVFSAKYKDFISQECVSATCFPDPNNPQVFQYINLDRVNVRGAEARLEARAENGLYGRLSLAYADGNVESAVRGRLPLASIDPLKLVAGIGYRAPRGRFGGELIATYSARKEIEDTLGTDAGGGATTICGGSPCYRPAAFTILDATAFVRLGEALTLRAGVFNILNAKYAWWSDARGVLATSSITDAYTQPGRNASASLSFRF